MSDNDKKNELTETELEPVAGGVYDDGGCTPTNPFDPNGGGTGPYDPTQDPPGY